MMNDTPQPVELGRYVLFYAISLFSITVVAMLITLFVFELPRGVNIGIVVASASIVASKFTQDQKRRFTSQEKHRLSAFCLGVNIALGATVITVVSLFLFGQDLGQVLQAGLQSVGTPLFAGLTIVFLVIYYFAHFLIFGMMNKIMLKNIEKAEARRT